MPIINNFLKSTRKNDILAGYQDNQVDAAAADRQKTLIINMCRFFAGRVDEINDSELKELLKCRYFTPSDGLTESARGLFSHLIQQSGITGYNDITELLRQNKINFIGDEITRINSNIQALQNNNIKIISKNNYSETISRINFLTISALNQLIVDLEELKIINASQIAVLNELQNAVNIAIYQKNEDVNLFSLPKKDIVKLAQNRHIKEEQFKDKITQLENKIAELTSKINQAGSDLAQLRIKNDGKLDSQIDKVLQLANQLNDLKLKLVENLNTLKENHKIYSKTKSFFDYQCNFTKLSLDQLNEKIQNFNLLYRDMIVLYPNDSDIQRHYNNINQQFNDELAKRTKNLGEMLSSKIVNDYLDRIFDNSKNGSVKKVIQKYQLSLTDKSITLSKNELDQLKSVSTEINSNLKDTNNLSVSKFLIPVFEQVSRDVSHRLNEAIIYENELDRLATIGWNGSIPIAENQKELNAALNKFNQIKRFSKDLQLNLTEDKANAVEQSIAAFTTKIGEIQAVKDEINKLSDCKNVGELKEEWGKLYDKHQGLIDSTNELKQLKVQINQRIDFSEDEPDLAEINNELKNLDSLLNNIDTRLINNWFRDIVGSIGKCISNLDKLNIYTKKLRGSGFKLINDQLFLQRVEGLIDLRQKLLNNLEQLPAKFETENYTPSFINKIKEGVNTAKLVFNDENNVLPAGFDMSVIASYVEFHMELVPLTSTLPNSVRTLEESNQKLRTTITQTIERKQEQLTVIIQKIKEVRDQFGQDQKALEDLKTWLVKVPFLESCVEFSEVLLHDIKGCDELLEKLNSRLNYYKNVFVALDSQQKKEAEFINKYRGQDKQKILKEIRSAVLTKLTQIRNHAPFSPELIKDATKVADNYAQYLYAKITEPSKNELDQLLTYDFNTFKKDQSKANNLKSTFIAKSKELIELKNKCEIIIKTLEDENKAINEFEEGSKLYTDKDYKANAGRLNKILDAIRKLNILFTRFALIANDKQIINNLNEKIEQLEVNLNNNYTLGDLIQIYNYMIQQLNALKAKVKEVEKSIIVSSDYLKKYNEIDGSDKQPLGTSTVSRESILRVKEQFINKAIRNNIGIQKISATLTQINLGLKVLAKIITKPQIDLKTGERQKLKELFKIFAFIANNDIISVENVTDKMIEDHIKNKFGESWWTKLPIIGSLAAYFSNSSHTINNDDIKTVALLLNMFNTDNSLYEFRNFQGQYLSKNSVNSLTESSQQQIKENLNFFDQLENLSLSENNPPQNGEQSKAWQNDGQVWKESENSLYELMQTTSNFLDPNHNTGSNPQVQDSMRFYPQK